jgi:nitrate reductase cytochrome c-type subunit
VEQAESVPRVQAEQQRIDSEVAEAVKKHGLKDDEATKNTILRFARDYVEQPNMIELAVKDLLTLTGGAQRDLLGGEETESVTAGASPGNGSPDMSPEEITTGDPDETRKRAHKVAMSRLRG